MDNKENTRENMLYDDALIFDYLLPTYYIDIPTGYYTFIRIPIIIYFIDTK